MGQDEDRLRLLAAARTVMARGGEKFSIAALCAEAGLERSAFKAHFSGKAALMAALVQPEPEKPKPSETPAAAPTAGDAWLERRLRVFERALNALETKQDVLARDHALAIAVLQEKLAALGMRPAEKPVHLAAEAVAASQPVPHVAATIEPAALPEPRPVQERLDIVSQPIVVVPREEMANVLQTARGKLRPMEQAEEEQPEPDTKRLRWLAIGALSLVALFLCVGLTFGKGDAKAVALTGAGETHRQVAATPKDRLVALADAGDAQAQARLALAYLKGDGVAADKQAAARWSASAAQAGVPVAQYLLGALKVQGDGMKADPARAFALFAAAAAQGNLKAMHNLAIAYAQGAGTTKDETKAAEWFARAASHGYVDSAFDLAVLYERGQGVGQDLKQALKWYAVAAFRGDAPSQERVAFLRGQMKSDDVKLAMAAAGSFAPLPASREGNAL